MFSKCNSCFTWCCQAIPCVEKKYWKGNTLLYGPIERYKLDCMSIMAKHRVNPNRDRLGDSYVEGIGNYSKILTFLHKLAGDKEGNEQKLVALSTKGRKKKLFLFVTMESEKINSINL